jgi:hypothetical protein
MQNKNDERILKMRETVATKKKELELLAKPSYETNLSLVIQGERYNLNVASKAVLLSLLMDLVIMKVASEREELLKDFELSGFKIEQWIADIKTKLKMLDKRTKEQELKVLEDKLLTMLSEDKKIDLELDELEKMI